jgi:SAM-dependent methyltransferase
MIPTLAPAPTFGDLGDLDPVLYTAISQTFGYSWPRWNEGRDLRQAIADSFDCLACRYKQLLAPDYATEEAAAAYALGYLPRYYVKVRQILLESSWAIRQAGHLNVLDVGVGPGTASLGVIDSLASRCTERRVDCTSSVSVTLVDRSPAMLGMAERMLATRHLAATGSRDAGLWVMHQHSVDSDFRATKAVEDVARLGPFDLIAFSNCLSENIDPTSPPPQWAAEAVALLSPYVKLLANCGHLLVIEPGFGSSIGGVAETRQILLNQPGLHCVSASAWQTLPNAFWGAASPLALEILGDAARRGTARGSPYAYLLLRKECGGVSMRVQGPAS